MLRSGGKVKNPCKLCCLPVSNKNGLRCMGACKKWAHYKCLNFTPGKIVDIKAGLLKVNCPCPDCDYEPKEQYKNLAKLCGKELCPAARPPVCEVKNCPRNLCNGGTQTKKCPLKCEQNPSSDNCIILEKSDNIKRLKKTGERPLHDKESFSNHDQLPTLPTYSPPRSPKRPPKKCHPSNYPAPICPSPKFAPAKPKYKTPNCFLPKFSTQKKTSCLSKNSSPENSYQKIESPPASDDDCAKPTTKKCFNKNCPSNESNVSVRGSKSLCSAMQSNTSESYCCKKKDAVCTSNSDPMMPLTPGEARRALLNTIEEMCDTVGNFSKQFKNLMGDMMSALDRCR